MAETPEDQPTTFEVQFVAERETKNTVRFLEYEPIGAEVRIGVLYIKKSAHTMLGNPERLRVTVEVDDTEPFPRGGPKT